MKKIADFINEFRIFPRIVLITYVWILIDAYQWFKLQEDLSMEQNVFLGSLIAGATGFLKFYIEFRNNK